MTNIPGNTTPPPLPSDRQLVDAARSGHEAAWMELMNRHRPVIAATTAIDRNSRSARDVTEKSLAHVRANLDNEAGVGEQALRAFRPRALAAVTGGRYGPIPIDDESGRSGTQDQILLAAAFGRLPEPWQTVLWHTHVERLSSAEVSPLVGRSVNDVGELLTTAERGLVDAFLYEYATDVAPDTDAAALVMMFGGHVRSSLAPSEQRIVDDHLESGTALPSGHTSEESHRLISMLASLPEALPDAVTPGVTGMSVQQYRRALDTARAAGPQGATAGSDRNKKLLVVGAFVVGALALTGAILQFSPSDDVTSSSDPAQTDGSGSSVDGSDPSVSPTSDAVATTLDLRPTGRPNEIGLVMNSGLRAEDVGTREDELLTTVTAPAPVFAGGTGTLDLAVLNDSGQKIDANFDLMLPSGVSFDGLVGGDAVCVDPENASPFCDITVEPNSTREVSVQLRLESRIVGRLVVDGESLVDPFETQIVAVSDLLHNSVGRGDVLMIGNTLMGCGDEATAAGIDCADVDASVGPVVDRWDVPMQFIGAAPAFGFSNSSRAVLDLPDGARIRSAHLFWAGDIEEAGRAIAGNGQTTTTMVLPTGDVVAVEAAQTQFGEEDATQYLSHVDVTSFMKRGGGGEYTVGNIASVESKGSFGAWSLVVVTDDDSLPRRQRFVLDPFDWVAPQRDFTFRSQIPTARLESTPVQVKVFGLEGERGLGGEALSIGGVAIDDDNALNSSISGTRTPALENNLGVDLDAYALEIDTSAGSLDLGATSSNDGVRVAVLAVTVDLES